MQAWLQGMNPQAVQFLAVRIRRGHVLEDALNQIAARADELKKPLRIIFSSGSVLSGSLILLQIYTVLQLCVGRGWQRPVKFVDSTVVEGPQAEPVSDRL